MRGRGGRGWHGRGPACAAAQRRPSRQRTLSLSSECVEAYRGWGPDAPLRSRGPGGDEADLFLWSASATPCPGVTSGVRENLGEFGGERQLVPPFACPSRSLRARFSCSVFSCPDLDKPKLPIAGEVWELRDRPREDLERPVEVLALVCRHEARSKEGTPRWDRRMEGDVGVDAGIEERLPQKYGLPVLPDQHRDDRSDRLGAVGQRPGLDDSQAQPAE